MHPKLKNRPGDEPASASAVIPPLVHDVTQATASALAASRHSLVATQPASGPANHARHHVSRKTQA
jgi:hypothetical protein